MGLRSRWSHQPACERPKSFWRKTHRDTVTDKELWWHFPVTSGSRRPVPQCPCQTLRRSQLAGRWALFAVLMLSCHLIQVHSIVSGSERAALLALYQSTNGTGWRSVVGWPAFATNVSADPCKSSLSGVTCSASGTSITYEFPKYDDSTQRDAVCRMK